MSSRTRPRQASCRWPNSGPANQLPNHLVQAAAAQQAAYPTRRQRVNSPSSSRSGSHPDCARTSSQPLHLQEHLSRPQSSPTFCHAKSPLKRNSDLVGVHLLRTTPPQLHPRASVRLIVPSCWSSSYGGYYTVHVPFALRSTLHFPFAAAQRTKRHICFHPVFAGTHPSPSLHRLLLFLHSPTGSRQVRRDVETALGRDRASLLAMLLIAHQFCIFLLASVPIRPCDEVFTDLALLIGCILYSPEK
jgi:hypothetical protein